MFLRQILRPFSSFPTPEPAPISSVLLTVSNDSPGKLKQILDVFARHSLNLTHIESQPASITDCSKGNCFIIDFECPYNSTAKTAFQDLEGQEVQVKESECLEVKWFPRTLSDLDTLDQKTLAAGAELESDHPGFKDPEYRARRHQIAEIALSHNCSDKHIPRVDYTPQEVQTWGKIFDLLSPLHARYACREYNESIAEMREHCGFRRDNIPQMVDINEYLSAKTGFRMNPIAGLLSARDFLNYLAFRVFASTQYIRHHSAPMYTPEPDIVHELIGHAPLFANKEFADFSQQIGLASLGASDADIKKLATCYWFSVEFGLIQEERGEKKIYGAGILSSAGEIAHAMEGKPEMRFFNPEVVCDIEYPIVTMQPMYCWSRSFEEAKIMMNKYAAALSKHFITSFIKEKNEIKVYQNIKISKSAY